MLEAVKARVRTSQVRAVRAANSEVLALSWSVDRDILDRQTRAGWGAKVVDRLAADLQAAFPQQRGWSGRNLQYMRALAAAWPEEQDLCSSLLHNFPEPSSPPCWTGSTTRPRVTGTRSVRSRTGGHVRCGSTTSPQAA